MSKDISFAERTALMRTAALDATLLIAKVKDIADVIAAEADQMQAAQERFSARRKPQERQKASR